MNVTMIFRLDKRMGMKEIIPVTPQLDMELRNRLLKLYYAEMGRSYDRFDSISGSACIYVVRSVLDKPLQCAYQLSSFQTELFDRVSQIFG